MKTQLSYLKTLLIYPMRVPASSWAEFGCFNHKYLILVSKPENWVWPLQGREWKSGKKGSKTKRGMSSSKVWYQGDFPRPFCQRCYLWAQGTKFWLMSDLETWKDPQEKWICSAAAPWEELGGGKCFGPFKLCFSSTWGLRAPFS